MQDFLSIVANDIIQRYGTDLSRTLIIFPNKRASLFFNDALFTAAGSKAIWSCRYLTISELFRSISTYDVADPIKLISMLYRVYCDITGSSESLDSFYGGGQLLLSDFDDLDKNLADAHIVFENTGQLHEYDNIDYLDDEHKRILKRFFSNFTDDQPSRIKEQFAKFWNKLFDIYTTFRNTISGEGIAYEGMLYRDTIENHEVTIDADRCIFVGFNFLHKVEQQLILRLMEVKPGSIRFYWDYDKWYMRDGQEAGQFIRQYLRLFPNDLTPDSDTFTNIANPRNITFLKASTEDIQARYITQWLTPERVKAGKRTAIVLCDENLLPAVINCLPETVEHVNITAGYPLSHTPSAQLVRIMFQLHRMGASREKGRLRLRIVNSVLHHPYMQHLSPLVPQLVSDLNSQSVFFPTIDQLSLDDNLRELFTPLSQQDKYSQLGANVAVVSHLLWVIKTIASRLPDNPDPLVQEALFRTYTLVNRICNLTREGNLDVDIVTLERLILEAIQSTTIPFHGEPVMGIQIMGLLETRNLDFDHILVLSCNEGNMPKGVNDSSFIPHAIRKAHSLTTVENKVSIYAYYFFRLMQRASDITYAYNTSTDDGKTGEMSRFMLQMLVDKQISSPAVMQLMPAKASAPTDVEAEPSVDPDTDASETVVPKTGEVMSKLDELTSLSPSAIGKYLRCPLSFFYYAVCHISEEEDSDEEVMDNRIFGLIYHSVMEQIYKPFARRNVTEHDINSLLRQPAVINDYIDRAFKKELFHFTPEEMDTRAMPRLDGNEILQRSIVSRLVNMTLRYDLRCCPFTIIDVERWVSDSLTFATDRGERTLGIKGIIDRIDKQKDGTVRVVDYKTGRSQATVSDVGQIFDSAAISKHSDYYLQTFLYSTIVSKEMPYSNIQPALLYPLLSSGSDYSPVLAFRKPRQKGVPIGDIRTCSDEFGERLRGLLSEIFSSQVPFRPTDDKNRCARCRYQALCIAK